MLATGLVVAEQNDALSSRTFAAAEAGFNLAYSNDQMTARAIGERTVDLLGSFDPSDSGQSSVTEYRSTWRMKTATGVSKLASRSSFDSNS